MDDLRDALVRTRSKPLRAALEAADTRRGRRSDQAAFRSWQGPWQRDVRYTVGDVVEHAGSSFRCLLSHIDNEPPSPAWELVAARGAAGPPGARGFIGPQGPQGPAGAGGTPSNTVVTEQTYGQNDGAGASLEFSRGDHTHGTPIAPVAIIVG